MLTLKRDQILAFRRRVNHLEHRLELSPQSLRQVGRAGLQDSMPRAAVLSLHARLSGVTAAVLDAPDLVQVWGPRYSVYVAAAVDRAVFTLGRWPDAPRAQERATRLAAQLAAHLDGRREKYDDVGTALGINANALRYATTTGTVLLRWDGARAPEVWTASAPDVEPAAARAELTRRYLHVFGPGTPSGLATWAGITERVAAGCFTALAAELTPVRTPLGEASILTADAADFRAGGDPAGGVRLLPSGDALYLLWGTERTLLVPGAAQRAQLWTSRVWPGAILLDGEIIGTWRRAHTKLTLSPWRRVTPSERTAIEAEAASLPLPLRDAGIQVAWGPGQD